MSYTNNPLLHTQRPLVDRRVLVVEGDSAASQALTPALTYLSTQTLFAHDGKTALKIFYDSRPELVLIGTPIRERDSLDVIRMIRLVTDIPLIICVERCTDSEIVQWLNCGADDVLTKPISEEIFIARIKAILRRCQQTETHAASVYDDGHMRIGPDGSHVMVKGERIKLTGTERRLLTLLYANAEKCLTYDAILSSVWGGDTTYSESYVHVYMSRLRSKIEEDPKNPIYFQTVYGKGYRFKPSAPL